MLSPFIARALRAFFYLLYQPMAWSYDLVAALVSAGRWKDWVFSVLPYVEGERVLEIGHGPGHLQAALIQKGITTFGLDASPQMGRLAAGRLRRIGLTPRLVRGYTQTLPFPENTFDQIVSTFPAEFIAAPETLAECYRTLKPGGEFLVLPAAWITGQSLLDRGLAALFRVTNQAPEWDPRWTEPFSGAGFQVQVTWITQKSWKLVVLRARKF
jgi:ubiquinone/menaquinone biosynthesis C-methylase UbiE